MEDQEREFSIENDTKILELEKFLQNNQYLSGEKAPNHVDSKIFEDLKLKKLVPNKQIYPNLNAWFGWLNNFTISFRNQLIEQNKQQLKLKEQKEQEKQQKKEVKTQQQSNLLENSPQNNNQTNQNEKIDEDQSKGSPKSANQSENNK